MENGPLIRTKLHLPLTRPALVPRPRLQGQILHGLRGPLTLITAPAGFGKTTLVASSIALCGLPAAWLSLDKNDNQAGRFLSYLIAALQTADQRIGAEAAQLMQGIQPALPDAVITSLINDLDGAGLDLVLVIDDYQLMQNPAVHEQLVFLLDHCPANFHLVVATRSDPPLPLSRLRARSQMVELRAADLRFTPEEAALFLNDVMGLHLDGKSVAQLEERTEGWIAGLQMAALSLREGKNAIRFIEGFSGTDRYILDYLLEEVLANQPPEVQEFLLCTSILDRMTAPLCDAILLNEESSAGANAFEETSAAATAIQSAAVLKTLERENLFLVPLDNERIWYRYHHLFADLLKARLQQTSPGLIPQIHLRASKWLEQNGVITEAIQHLLAANEFNQAADLIDRYGTKRWVANDLSVVLMAENLPEKILLDHPKIGISLAWLYINQGLIRKAMPLLRQLEQHYSGKRDLSDPAWILTIVQLALAFLGQRTPSQVVGLLPSDEQMDEIPEEELMLHDAAEILYGMALARRGELVHAVEFAEKALKKVSVSPEVISFPSLVPFLATMYLFLGRNHTAFTLSREYLDVIKEKGILVSSAGNLDIVMGSVLYEWNLLADAEKHIRKGLQANEPWGNIMTNGFGLVVLNEILVAKGDFSGALQAAEKLITILQTQATPVEFEEALRTMKVNILLASGDLISTKDWLNDVRLKDDFRLHPEFYTLTLARIFLAQGKYPDAVEILTTQISSGGIESQLSRILESKLLLAVALAGCDRLAESYPIIEECLATAEPEGSIRVFLKLGKSCRDLLGAYCRADTGAYKQFAQKVFNSFASNGGEASTGTAPSGLAEPLSVRELEVLGLMAEGKTNPEIARRLFVAPGTVKAHTASIYRKLGAANRTEAVGLARKLGILK